ncbi:hypothetical protein BDQ12DRAFT_124054 [Crucibulum laeve]|uniref:Mid2 domain-containing protein n=1 Tax=Crucibulum laeve TaxID=68775 RepID=A0A5C3LZ87_9AGAR|nr:hypothetical protein BDQ12DRAFT_124054 [Crucibulum laeve]
MPSTALPTFLLALCLPALTSAYTWNFQEAAKQCSNLTIQISGSDGKPPYRVLILPIGPSPLPNNVEARKIVDMPFDSNATSVSFQLKYPANSQFVAVISDATGFGSGGTSVAAQVTDSSDASCFDATTAVKPPFTFAIEPPSQIVQCQDTRLWWDKSTVQGTPNFLGIIPGGQSFAIPESSITDVQSQGTGFTWKPNLRGGTTLIIVGGDNRGNGTAGSSFQVVGSNTNNDGSCLSGNSPSSTPGSPAGGTYPTSTDGTGVGSDSRSSGSKTNTGAIVGGVIGGIVALIVLILLLLFFKRRRRVHNQEKKRPLDLLSADDEGDDANHTGPHSGRNELPQYYQPEPFMVPDPTLAGSTDGHTDGGRPMSQSRTSFSRSGTPDLLGGGATSSTSGGARKGGMKQLRPVNIIQHDDAGPSVAPKAEEAETIELPPAYTNIKKEPTITPPTQAVE